MFTYWAKRNHCTEVTTCCQWRLVSWSLWLVLGVWGYSLWAECSSQLLWLCSPSASAVSLTTACWSVNACAEKHFLHSAYHTVGREILRWHEYIRCGIHTPKIKAANLYIAMVHPREYFRPLKLPIPLVLQYNIVDRWVTLKLDRNPWPTSIGAIP